MITEADLRAMSESERRKLALVLARIDYPRPLLAVDRARRRRLAILASVIACVVLVAWIIVLLLTLHHSFHTRHWRGAWVGFDLFELAGFAAIGWAFWRGRQVVIACLVVTATLLFCDAWFDVALDVGTSDIWGSVASAAFIELPLAFIMFNLARRLIRVSAVLAAGSAVVSDGDGLFGDSLPPLWKIPLFGGLPVLAPDGKERHHIGRETRPVSREDDPPDPPV